jgi:hypothetical protein
VDLGPTHVSVYDLIVERGTLFGRWFPAAAADGDSDDDGPAPGPDIQVRSDAGAHGAAGGML